MNYGWLSGQKPFQFIFYYEGQQSSLHLYKLEGGNEMGHNGGNSNGWGFALIVVLFILLIIVGVSYVY